MKEEDLLPHCFTWHVPVKIQENVFRQSNVSVLSDSSVGKSCNGDQDTFGMGSIFFFPSADKLVMIDSQSSALQLHDSFMLPTRRCNNPGCVVQQRLHRAQYTMLKRCWYCSV